jgi:hypothetical protein
VRELRTQVAHYGDVVHDVDAELLSAGRNVHQPSETHDDVVRALDALRSWADAETGVDLGADRAARRRRGPAAGRATGTARTPA